MHRIEIPDKNIIIDIPECWEECSVQQAQFILKQAFEVLAGNLSIGDFRIKIFKHLSNLKVGVAYFVRRKLKISNASDENIYKLSASLCNWIFYKNDSGAYELDFKTIINFYPVLLDKYFGPQDLLSDLTFNDFKNALSVLDQYYSEKNESQSTELLDYFIALLYHKQNTNDIKASVSQKEVKPEVFQTVPLYIKQIIAIWFSYCVKCLQEEDLVINGVDVNFSVLFPKGSTSTKNHQKTYLGWTGILMDIAESGVFGNTVGTGQTLIYDILLYLLKKHEDKPKEK